MYILYSCGQSANYRIFSNLMKIYQNITHFVNLDTFHRPKALNLKLKENSKAS